jgi:hypothetical protein
MSPPRALHTLRRSKARVVMLALAALLCAQAALAFYRCPVLASGARGSAELPCEAMDRESPALCKAFVQGDAQGLEGKRASCDAAPGAPLWAGLLLAFALPAPRGDPRARRAPPRTRPPPLWLTCGRQRD